MTAWLLRNKFPVGTWGQVKSTPCQAWWYTPVALALERLRQEDHKI